MLRQTILKECQALLKLIQVTNTLIEQAIAGNYGVEIYLQGYNSGTASLNVLSFTRNEIDNTNDRVSPDQLLASVDQINSELKRLRQQDFDVEIVHASTETPLISLCQVYVIVIKPKLQ